VSSLFIVEGQPALVYAVITPNSDLYDVAQASGTFVVHICTRDDAGLADVFAGIRPSPGGVFATSDVEYTKWGPTLRAVENRIRCRTRSISEVGWSGILVGELVDSEISDLTDPLVYFRGSYRHLD
jgi:flavin reductase (DIM6/NTAB) family NADH-FMN oxidoreductase RutF